ncbi:hypothetical protein GPX89_14130 [Nocardia sp. ET3-3]|uniref:Uncharacterized protein n=1 Tax=Nocardia terrae TaxID=2675851 RepID=A0A7K1UWY4_9NOCA|nr:hypothetical protein [Nocardia terrae]MVU78378.1 hypothetical protein [Nocardia terrae]
MKSNSSLALRIWRLRPWSMNPLMRGSDRCEALLRTLVMVGLLLMVPISGAIGSTTYTRSAAQIQADHASKVQISATAVADATQLPSSGPYRDSGYRASVRWVRGGVDSTAIVDVDKNVKAGAVVPIWVGTDGKPTRAPAGADTAALDGIGIGLMVLLLSGTCAIALLWAMEVLLSGVRNLQWEIEWRRVSRPIGT